MIWKTKQGWSSAMTIEILWWYDNDKLRNSLTYSWEILYNITERNMLKLVRGRWRAYLSGVFWGVLWGRESMIFGWLQRLSRILPHGKQDKWRYRSKCSRLLPLFFRPSFVLCIQRDTGRSMTTHRLHKLDRTHGYYSDTENYTEQTC